MPQVLFRFALVLIVGFHLLFGIQQYSHARISVTVDFHCFPAKSGNGNLILMFGVDGRSLKYVKNKAGFYKGTSSFAIAINDSIHNYFGDRLDLNTPDLPDSSRFDQSFSTVKVFSLPAGKYEVDMVIFDPNSSDTTKEKLSFSIEIVDAGKNAVLSDLILTNPGFFNSTRSIFDQGITAMRPSDFYAKNDSLLQFYSEAYGLTNKIANGTPLISRVRILEQSSKGSLDEFGKIKRITSSEKMAYITDLVIRKLPSGNYILIWDLIDTNGVILAKSFRNFKKSNPDLKSEFSESDPIASDDQLTAQINKLTQAECAHLVASLLPISKNSDHPTIEYLRKRGTDSELRNFLISFWSKRSGQNAFKELGQYRILLATADKLYSTQTMKAYQTERGRIFLSYGKPDIVENEYSDRKRKAMQNLNTIPYEVWYYYSLESPIKQSDVMFVFVQQNRGNSNYRLIHSSAIGEVRNGEWRSLIENNSTFNFDRMNPDDRNEQANPRNAR